MAKMDESLDRIFLEHAKQISVAEPRKARNSNYFPKIKKKRKKIRTCQNMAGILGVSQCQFSLNLISIPGGSNAFNFINFVAAVVTLMVNVNNNINNNNNNLNNVNVNTNNANNANANVNNNGVNSVVVMPGR